MVLLLGLLLLLLLLSMVLLSTMLPLSMVLLSTVLAKEAAAAVVPPPDSEGHGTHMGLASASLSPSLLQTSTRSLRAGPLAAGACHDAVGAG